MNNKSDFLAKYQSVIGEYSYINEFLSLSMARFKWKGLPKTVPNGYIEEVLFRGGMICVYEDKDFGLMYLECTPMARKNLYRQPLAYKVMQGNYNKTIKAEDCVIIKNSPSGMSYYDFFFVAAYTLNEIDKAIRVNVKAQKTPHIVIANDNQRLTMKKFYEQIDDGDPVVYLNDKLKMDNIEVFDVIAPYVCQNLYDTKNSILAECYQRLGLNNITRTKKERLTESESEINEDSSNLYLDMLLDTRMLSCEDINDKFDVSVSVEVNTHGEVYNNNDGNGEG